MGKTTPDQSKQQWTGPLLVQTMEDPPAAAPVAAAPATEAAPVPATPEKVEAASTAKLGTPQASYEAKAKAVAAAAETVNQQYADEAE
jgi:hypothetical protein